jgi:hypothetical protein
VETSDIGHSHTESEITDLDKYTRNEVDTALNGKADVGHSHTEFPRVWTTSPGGAQKTGDLWTDGIDVKICVNGDTGNTSVSIINFEVEINNYKIQNLTYLRWLMFVQIKQV